MGMVGDAADRARREAADRRQADADEMRRRKRAFETGRGEVADILHEFDRLARETSLASRFMPAPGAQRHFEIRFESPHGGQVRDYVFLENQSTTRLFGSRTHHVWAVPTIALPGHNYYGNKEYRYVEFDVGSDRDAILEAITEAAHPRGEFKFDYFKEPAWLVAMLGALVADPETCANRALRR